MATTSYDIDGRSGLLVRLPAGAFRALGAFGRPAYQNFDQIQSTLSGRVSPACLAYFARPPASSEQKEFRWTAPATGPIRPWRELSDVERQAGEAVLEQIGVELAELREQFRQRGGQSMAYASLLDEAVKVPPHEGDDCHFLYLVGTQPVAAFWGFETHDGRWFDPTAPRAVPASPPPNAAAAAQLPAAAPVVPPPLQPAAATSHSATPTVPPRPQIEPPKYFDPPVAPLRTTTLTHDIAPLRRPWWAFWRGGTWARTLGGLLGLMLLALLLMLLLRGCDTKPATPPVLGTSANDRSGAPALSSLPAIPAAPSALTPSPGTPATTLPPAAALRQQQTDPATVPPSAPPPNPSPTTPPQGASAMGPLQGQWRAGEDLFDQNTGQPLDLTFAFGPDGNGKVTMRRPDGSICNGAIASKANGARTTIEGASIPCPSGGSYAPPRVECTRAPEGPLLCFGINPDGSRYRMAMRPAN